MSRLYVVIPAAGHSRRMREPKLLMELGGRSIISHLLETVLGVPEVRKVVVVVRRDDRDLREHLKQYSDGRLVVLTPESNPPEMRDSVELALNTISEMESPSIEDGWALIPADHPLISRNTFQMVCDAWRKSSSDILMPRVRGRGGHPTFFHWPIVEEVAELTTDEGLNAIVYSDPNRVEHLDCDAEELLFDLDTPEDWDRVQVWWSSRKNID